MVFHVFYLFYQKGDREPLASRSFRPVSGLFALAVQGSPGLEEDGSGPDVGREVVV
jgi:hypothetical protein